MAKFHRAQAILLLADGFDEAAVGILLAGLRQAGLPVSLVGLRSTLISGAHGLVLMPDTGLDQLLEGATSIAALIVPGGSGHLGRLRVDPRASILLQRGISEEAILVSLDDEATRMMIDLAELKAKPLNIRTPDGGVPLDDFAYQLARDLGNRLEG